MGPPNVMWTLVDIRPSNYIYSYLRSILTIVNLELCEPQLSYRTGAPLCRGLPDLLKSTSIVWGNFPLSMVNSSFCRWFFLSWDDFPVVMFDYQTHMLHVYPWCWDIYQHLPYKRASCVGRHTIHGASGRGYSLVPTGSLEVSRPSLVVQPLISSKRRIFFFFSRKARSEKSPCSHQTSFKNILELDFNQKTMKIVRWTLSILGFYIFFSVKEAVPVPLAKRLQAIIDFFVA